MLIYDHVDFIKLTQIKIQNMANRLPHLHKKRIEQPSQQHQPHTQLPHYEPTPVRQQYHHHKPKSLEDSRPLFPSTNQITPFDKHGYRKGERSFPPPQSLFTSRDTEVDPRFIRTTCAALSGPVQKTSFPIALWITPFASEEVAVAEVTAPLRCHRCKSYVNPYFQFDGTRRSVTCNMCGLRFAVQESIDKTNLTSTEIATQSIIDFRVSDKFYMKKRTDIIKVIVLVELSMSMMELGIFATVLDSIKSVLESHQFQEKVRIGIAFYGDNGVGFLRVPEGEGAQPTVFTVPQGKGSLGCCPLSDSQFLLDPNEQRQHLLGMIDFLQTYSQFVWKQGRFTHTSNYAFALRCMRDNFENQTGRILLFSLLDPRTPPCQIRPRNEEELKTPLKPLTLEGHQYAKQLLRARIGVDHFVFSKETLVSHELATMHFLSSSTGGKIYHYSHYNSQTHGQHLYYSIFYSLTKTWVCDLDFTCRASNGLTVTRYGAGDGLRESRDVGLSVVDNSSSFTIQLQQEQKLEQHLGAFAQFAAMYTNASGQRRIRVITYKFDVSNQPGILYQSIDYLTLANVILKNYSGKLIRGGEPTKIRTDAINFIGAIVGQSKARYSGTTTSVGDVTVPPGMAWSFAYLSSILNSRLFLNSIKLSPDQRIARYLTIHQMNPYFFSNTIYPKLYPLTLDIYEVEEGNPMPGDFLEEESTEDENKIAILPPNRPLTRQSIKDLGVFLVDSGDELIIYVENNADEELLMELFGTVDFQEIETQGLPELQTSHNIRVNNIVNEIRRRSSLNGGMYQPLSVKTPLKKGPFSQALTVLLKQDSYQCTFSSFLDEVLKAIVVPK